jgi:hypothetical protein
MSRTVFRAAALLPAAALAAASLAAPLAAQSALASRGLGYPIEPLDARARGMGGVTTGLAEPGFSMINPAAAVGIPAPGFVVTFQPDEYDFTSGGVGTSGTTARFPLLQAAFPVRGRFVGSIGYGAYLDQNWQVQQTDSLDLAGGRAEVTDRFVSNGALARFRVGAGYRATDRLAVGVAADLVTGAVRDSSSRFLGETFVSATSGVTYRYSGIGLAAGARWNATDALTVAAAVSGGGEITAEAADDNEDDDLEVPAQEKSYPRPLEVDAGASARIAQTAVVALSARWVGWSGADDELSGSGGARDALSASLGVEYDGFNLFGRPVPLRLGGRYTQLPFRWEGVDSGNEFPEERALSAGAGLRLAGGLARLDAAAERGWRGGDAAGFEEPFWRFSFSLSVLGR